jgi:predicted helicase
MQTSPTLEKTLKAFFKTLPERVAVLRQSVEAAHIRSAEFHAASFACLDALLAHLRQENRRQALFEVFPPHLAFWQPDLDAVKLDELVIQHLLLEPFFQCVFPESLKLNVIACSLSRVLDALEASGFDRRSFLSPLDLYYRSLSHEFRSCASRKDQQQILSSFCEQFINAYDPAQAEEFSVIYTPQEIVGYMCERVEQELQRNFDRSLSSPNVPILDPCTGIGTYVSFAMGLIGREMLPYKYRHELFAIEIMILPYWIALLNIEQTFVNLTGWYVPFPGLRYASALA